jgi:hypothetical protein
MLDGGSTGHTKLRFERTYILDSMPLRVSILIARNSNFKVHTSHNIIKRGRKNYQRYWEFAIALREVHQKSFNQKAFEATLHLASCILGYLSLEFSPRLL